MSFTDVSSVNASSTTYVAPSVTVATEDGNAPKVYNLRHPVIFEEYVCHVIRSIELIREKGVGVTGAQREQVHLKKEIAEKAWKEYQETDPHALTTLAQLKGIYDEVLGKDVA